MNKSLLWITRKRAYILMFYHTEFISLSYGFLHVIRYGYVQNRFHDLISSYIYK